MKIVSSIGAALLWAAAAGFGEVYSRNAAGFIKIRVPARGFVMATVPFHGFEGPDPRTITEIFGDQLTGTDGYLFGSDTIMRYDAEEQVYRIFWKAEARAHGLAADEWRDTEDLSRATGQTLVPGEAFFICNSRDEEQFVFLAGEVPAEPVSVVEIQAGFNQVGSPFPVEMALNDTALAQGARPGFFGDQVSRWDAHAGAYAMYFYDDGTVISPPAGWRSFSDPTRPTGDVLAPGEGFFYNRSLPVGFGWTEVKPFAWP